ncbi:MAG: RluA family pseudouridine synthase [Minisyncoccota bacterium]
MEIPILYEDENIVAINKPSGLMVHGDGNSTEKTLVDWVREKFPNIEGVGEQIEITEDDFIDRPGIVHRLDKDTSGVMLIAKTEDGFQTLKSQFQNREIKKIYHAFVYGIPKEVRGLIDRPIGRSPHDIRQWSCDRGARGLKRDAVTRYVLKESANGVAFLQIMPETGRTHQIRVHFKSVRHPLIGDGLYASTMPPKLGFTRTALHARIIEFVNCDGKTIRIEAPYPKDFEEAFKLLRN